MTRKHKSRKSYRIPVNKRVDRPATMEYKRKAAISKSRSNFLLRSLCRKSCRKSRGGSNKYDSRRRAIQLKNVYKSTPRTNNSRSMPITRRTPLNKLSKQLYHGLNTLLPLDEISYAIASHAQYDFLLRQAIELMHRYLYIKYLNPEQMIQLAQEKTGILTPLTVNEAYNILIKLNTNVIRGLRLILRKIPVADPSHNKVATMLNNISIYNTIPLI